MVGGGGGFCCFLYCFVVVDFVFGQIKSETRMTASILKQVPNT